MRVEDPSVLVIGAGPAGLAVSKYLTDLALSYDLIDRYGETGGSYCRMYPRMQLSSPPVYLTLPGAPAPSSEGYLRVSDYVSYLNEYAIKKRIKPKQATVTKVEPSESLFVVTFAENIQSKVYHSIVVCTGSFDHPVIPIIPGLNDDSGQNAIPFCHARAWNGPERFRNSRLLIVGGGMTAIEIAEECVRCGITPMMSFRPGRGKTFPAQVLGINPRFFSYPIMRRTPARLVRRQCMTGWAYRGINRGFKTFCEQRRIDLRPRLESTQGQLVTFAGGSSAEVDYIVFATGYRWDVPFLPASTERAALGNPLLVRGESVTWPGIFFVGMTCAFTASSHFIHGICDDARLVADMILKRSCNS